MIFLDKYPQCIDKQLNKTTQTNVVLKEKGRRYCLINNANTWEVTKVQIENCVIKSIGEKGCEAILIAEKESVKNRGYFIELKGVSVGHSFKQIENSLNKTVADLKNVILFGRVIPSEYKRNKFLESTELKLILKFKSLGGNFIVRENCEDEI
ncbi:MAG: hypothetical protein ABI707_10670 [Ferruginibacter sp.]